ncbi:MAG: VPLPA-CTERM sorting domain-containing protein [Methylococcaceae bacterium]
MKLHFLDTESSRISIFLKSLILFVVSLSVVHASTVFQFEGKLTNVDAPLLETFSIGDAFSGSYTFDPVTSNSSTPNHTSFNRAISEITFTSSAFNVTGKDGDITIGSNSQRGPFYAVNVAGSTSRDTIDDLSLNSWHIEWEPDNPFIFPQNTPPTDPSFNPLNDNSFFSLVFFNSAAIDQDGIPLHVGISGKLSSVTSVPIPAAVWLFASGLLGLIRMKRK